MARYEEYFKTDGELPFFLQPFLTRTKDTCSKESNWHEEFEVHLYCGGEGVVLLDGECFPVGSGDMICIDSGCIHRTQTESKVCFHCLIVRADFCKSVGFSLDELRFVPLVNDEEAKKLFERLLSLYQTENGVARTAKLVAALLDLLAYLQENCLADKSPVSQRESYQSVKAAILYIRKNYANKLSLDEIAKAAYENKFALTRKFKRATGKTVVQYVNEHRIGQVKELLANGETISDAAYACGFNNLSFFTKIFKRCAGRLPSEYKKSIETI